MTSINIFRFLFVAGTLSLFFSAPAFSQQEGETKEKPNQLDVIKLDLFQIGVNEARLSYEMELSKTSSMELGLGYIYRNGLMYEYGGRPMLANGGGIYFALRKYMDKKKYFSEPKVRSYVSPHFFYRYSSFQNEWLAYTQTTPGLFDCELESGKFHQIGAVLRFGWQTSRGRMVFDFYSGLGVKLIPRNINVHVITPATASCQINTTSYAVSETTKDFGANVIINGGVKIGLRRNNRDRHYEEEPAADPTEVDPSSPPQF